MCLARTRNNLAKQFQWFTMVSGAHSRSDTSIVFQPLEADLVSLPAVLNATSTTALSTENSQKTQLRHLWPNKENEQDSKGVCVSQVEMVGLPLVPVGSNLSAQFHSDEKKQTELPTGIFARCLCQLNAFVRLTLATEKTRSAAFVYCSVD